MKKPYLSFVLLFLYSPIFFSSILSAQAPSISNELLDFSVSKSGEELIVNWTVISLNPQARFLLERAGVDKSFSTLLRIESKANDMEAKEYEFKDSHPLSGSNYYRLKQIDERGTVHIYPSIEMNSEPTSEFDFYLYHKIKAKELNLTINNPAKTSLQWELSDLNGKILAQDEIIGSQPEISCKIGTEYLSTGLYIIRLKSTTGKSISRRFQI